MNKQKGFGGLLIVILVAVGILAGIFLYMTYVKNMEGKKAGEMMLQEDSDKAEEFAPLEEDSSTPEEINNESVEELDSIMLEIDATMDEDLSDLDL